VEDLHETMYGERQYGARDLDGHHWLFSTHARDVSPVEWGATVTTQGKLLADDMLAAAVSAGKRLDVGRASGIRDHGGDRSRVVWAEVRRVRSSGGSRLRC
jgi:hypothetical protein